MLLLLFLYARPHDAPYSSASSVAIFQLTTCLITLCCLMLRCRPRSACSGGNVSRAIREWRWMMSRDARCSADAPRQLCSLIRLSQRPVLSPLPSDFEFIFTAYALTILSSRHLRRLHPQRERRHTGRQSLSASRHSHATAGEETGERVSVSLLSRHFIG